MGKNFIIVLLIWGGCLVVPAPGLAEDHDPVPVRAIFAEDPPAPQDRADEPLAGLESDDRTVRLRAIRGLSHTPEGTRAIHRLATSYIGELASSKFSNRERASNRLAEIRNHPAARSLLEVAASALDREVRLRAKNVLFPPSAEVDFHWLYRHLNQLAPKTDSLAEVTEVYEELDELITPQKREAIERLEKSGITQKEKSALAMGKLLFPNQLEFAGWSTYEAGPGGSWPMARYLNKRTGKYIQLGVVMGQLTLQAEQKRAVVSIPPATFRGVPVNRRLAGGKGMEHLQGKSLVLMSPPVYFEKGGVLKGDGPGTRRWSPSSRALTGLDTSLFLRQHYPKDESKIDPLRFDHLYNPHEKR